MMMISLKGEILKTGEFYGNEYFSGFMILIPRCTNFKHEAGSKQDGLQGTARTNQDSENVQIHLTHTLSYFLN